MTDLLTAIRDCAGPGQWCPVCDQGMGGTCALVPGHGDSVVDAGDCDEAQPPVPSCWRRYDILDPISQEYDDADCDSWRVPRRRTTGPCDPAWKGDYDRVGCMTRMYLGSGGDCAAAGEDAS